jgi:hypothetical protein
MAREYDFEAEEAKMDAQWKEIEYASAQLDKAAMDLDNTERARRMSSTSTPQRRQYTPEEMKQAKDFMKEVAAGPIGQLAADALVVGFKSVATVAAVAGAGVVSACKRDSSPISSTFDWCKKKLWGK